MLGQGDVGRDLPIAYASKAMTGAELNYSTTEKELLAMVFAVNYFRPYLYGRTFYLVTDHRPLVWLHNLKGLISRSARWRVILSEYEYEIIHKPGRVNANADALSRNPVLAMENVNLNAGSIRVNDNMHESQIEAFIGKIFRIASTSKPICERELLAGIITGAGEYHVDDACLPISVDDYDQESFAHWPSHVDDAGLPISVDDYEKEREREREREEGLAGHPEAGLRSYYAGFSRDWGVLS